MKYENLEHAVRLLREIDTASQEIASRLPSTNDLIESFVRSGQFFGPLANAIEQMQQRNASLNEWVVDYEMLGDELIKMGKENAQLKERNAVEGICPVCRLEITSHHPRVSDTQCNDSQLTHLWCRQQQRLAELDRENAQLKERLALRERKQ